MGRYMTPSSDHGLLGRLLSHLIVVQSIVFGFLEECIDLSPHVFSKGIFLSGKLVALIWSHE
jgi:hypothetical protein